MTFSRPTLETLIDRIQSDFNTRVPGGDSRLRRNFIYVLSRGCAGLVHGLYGFLAWIAKQIFPDQAEEESLARWCAIYKIPRQAATNATRTVGLVGTIGFIVQSGTTLRTANEIEFVTTEGVTIGGGGTASVPVEAVVAGTDANVIVGTKVYFVEPIDGIQSEAVVETELVDGVDLEDVESWRERLLARYRQPPMGGAEYDYIAWARSIAGVTRAWVYPGEMGVNHVTVRFMTDNLTDDGIPEAGKVTEVFNYISLPNVKPVTAILHVEAPEAAPLDFDITLKKADGTHETDPDIRAEVEAELRDLIYRDAEPGGPIKLSRINEAISIAAGEYDHELNDPTADVTNATGDISTMGDIVWTAP